MNDEIRQKIGLFRYSILAPLISGTYDNASSNKAFFRDAAKRTYTNPRGRCLSRKMAYFFIFFLPHYIF